MRRALYRAGVVACEYDPVLKAFRARLQDAGTSPKEAIVACARKLLTVLKARMRDATDYQRAEL